MNLNDNGRDRARRLIIPALILAASLTACHHATPAVPASFTPSPCPPGWHRDGGDCIITGTLAPGQPLPLPTINGTPVPLPAPVASILATLNPGGADQ